MNGSIIRLSTLLACLYFIVCTKTQANPNRDDITHWVHQFYTQQGLSTSYAEAALQIDEALFLLSQAKQVWPARLERENSVGFSTKVQQKRLLNAISHNVLALTCNAQNPQPALGAIRELVGDYPISGTIAEKTLDDLAKHTVLEHYSLADLYQDASLQIKMRLHQGDQNAANELIMLHNCYLQFKQKWQQTTPFSELEKVALALVIAPSMKHYFGVAEVLHGEPSEYVNALKNSISNQEITAYYHAHKSEFRYLKTVSAHIKPFATQQAAAAFIAQPGNVSAVTINKHKQNLPFAYQAAFNINPKQGWVVLRTPSQQFVAIRTLSQAYDYYLPDSETVRYQALANLTKQKAKHSYSLMFHQWQNNTKRATL